LETSPCVERNRLLGKFYSKPRMTRTKTTDENQSIRAHGKAEYEQRDE
jgi:hypothetical protein